MRKFILVLVPLCFAAPAGAQYNSSDYSLERYEEDYSYLRNVKSQKDFFDPVKYIPIGDGDWYLSLGGQARYRFDYFNNSAFGKGTQDETGFDLIRMLANVDVHFGPNLRAFVQIDGSLEYDRAGGVRPYDVDNGDFQQAFVDFNVPMSGGTSATIRLGRQELVYGAQRLVSPSDWSNVRRSFDGAKIAFAFPHIMTTFTF